MQYYAPRALRRKLRGIAVPGSDEWRDADAVRAAYDEERDYTLGRSQALTFEELVLVPPGGLVMELGSGNGRNLLHLKRRFPNRRFHGLDLSPVSVDLARHLAERFGIAVDFDVANACEPLPASESSRADLVYSSHAFEMMPRQFTGAIRNMFGLSRGHIIFFEPVPELWPWTPRGWASHFRAYLMDWLRGFMPALQEEIRNAPGWTIQSASRLGSSTNPINETCRIHLSRRP